MNIVNNLKQCLQEKKLLDADLKSYKLKLGVDVLNKKVKGLKLDLYNHLVNEGLDEIEGISIEKLLPPDEKKKVIKEKRKETITTILEEAKVKDVNNLADKIAEKL